MQQHMQLFKLKIKLKIKITTFKFMDTVTFSPNSVNKKKSKELFRICLATDLSLLRIIFINFSIKMVVLDLGRTDSQVVKSRCHAVSE